MADDKYIGQVILERGFATKARAEAWMERQQNRADLATHVEKHLWEPAESRSTKE